MQGLYVAFEGIVGSGKSTQSKRLYSWLSQELGRPVVWTREPGGSEVADAVRRVVQGTRFSEPMDPVCEAYLYAASRAHTIRTLVQPALAKGSVVISDRTFLSSLAYQGHARGLGIAKVLAINKQALAVQPDLVFYIHLDPNLGLSRAFDRQGDKFEDMDNTFFEKVQEGYRLLARRYRRSWITIEGDRGEDEVFADIAEKLRANAPWLWS